MDLHGDLYKNELLSVLIALCPDPYPKNSFISSLTPLLI